MTWAGVSRGVPFMAIIAVGCDHGSEKYVGNPSELSC